MCSNRVEKFPCPPFYPAKRKRQRLKKPKLQVLGLKNRRRRSEEEGKDMELKNLKLYLENQSIFEENEKLRKKANLLHQENLALFSEFQKKFPHFHRFSTTLLLLHANTSSLVN